jgi:hypothetical protein
MWEVWYSFEAANYLDDNGALVADLFLAMEALATSVGWPQVGNYQELDELIFWQIDHHLVIYQRRTDDQIVQIASIKPV